MLPFPLRTWDHSVQCRGLASVVSVSSASNNKSIYCTYAVWWQLRPQGNQ